MTPILSLSNTIDHDPNLDLCPIDRPQFLHYHYYCYPWLFPVPFPPFRLTTWENPWPWPWPCTFCDGFPNPCVDRTVSNIEPRCSRCRFRRPNDRNSNNVPWGKCNSSKLCLQGDFQIVSHSLARFRYWFQTHCITQYL